MAALRQAPHFRHSVGVDEDVGALRRAVARLTASQSDVRVGEAELVATELGTNLIRHADGGGYVLYRPVGDGIELISVDHGPGMSPADIPPPVARTPPLPPFMTGGLAAGLASIRRMAVDFDFYSTRQGTVILSRLGATNPAGPWRYGAVNIPLGGIGESGDAWAVTADRSASAALVVDGLGHGPGAAEAARAAITIFDRQPVTDLVAFVERAHQAMRSTRGGVLGVCAIGPQRHEVTYAGIGDITGMVVYGGEGRRILGRPGTLGTYQRLPNIHLQRFPWEPGATLILTSDGIHGHWGPVDYPGLLDHDPAVVAATIHRDHGRVADDATVLVVHETAPRNSLSV
jgi:anti-sigma regulatory factor (Ser/Thr protein kinase)